MPPSSGLLLEAGADAAAANRYGVRPLSLACTNGNAAVAELLLDAGADANTTLVEGETVLMTAARTGDLDIVRLLLERGADVNAAESWRGQTALMWAAAEGHAQLIPTMLSYGGDVSARSTKGWTPLLFAVREGRIDVVQTLLEAGVDVEEALPVTQETRRGGTSAERSATGLNAFLLAAANAHYELAGLLVDRGADVNVASRGWTALHQVSWVRKAGIAGSNNPAPKGSGSMTSLEFVRKIVGAGADLDARVTTRPPAGITRLNFLGGTPFLLAARTGDADLMRLLAELGADPLLPNDDGTTPLMVAAGVGTSAPGEDPGTEPEVLEAVKVALELGGGDLNAIDDNGETAMHGAALQARAQRGDAAGRGGRRRRCLEPAQFSGLDAVRHRGRRAPRHEHREQPCDCRRRSRGDGSGGRGGSCRAIEPTLTRGAATCRLSERRGGPNEYAWNDCGGCGGMCRRKCNRRGGLCLPRSRRRGGGRPRRRGRRRHRTGHLAAPVEPLVRSAFSTASAPGRRGCRRG